MISDKGKQFDCNEFKEFCDKLQIKKSFSSVARPQANGQKESINTTIKHNLKTKLDDLKEKWVDELPKMFWANRTTAKTSTGDLETPLSLSYGYEAMVPIEIGISLLRKENYDQDDENHLLQKCELDFLEEK